MFISRFSLFLSFCLLYVHGTVGGPPVDVDTTCELTFRMDDGTAIPSNTITQGTPIVDLAGFFSAASDGNVIMTGDPLNCGIMTMEQLFDDMGNPVSCAAIDAIGGGSLEDGVGQRTPGDDGNEDGYRVFALATNQGFNTSALAPGVYGFKLMANGCGKDGNDDKPENCMVCADLTVGSISDDECLDLGACISACQIENECEDPNCNRCCMCRCKCINELDTCIPPNVCTVVNGQYTEQCLTTTTKPDCDTGSLPLFP